MANAEPEPPQTQAAPPAIPAPGRMAAADTLKAAAILAVVWIHSSYSLPYVQTFNAVYGFGLRFCVPAFIFLWAYFAEDALSRRQGEINYLSDRAWKLLPPFFFWSAVYILVQPDFREGHYTKLWTRPWLGYGWNGQYFFLALFQLTVLFGLFRKIVQAARWVVPAALVVFGLFYAWLSYRIDAVPAGLQHLGERFFLFWVPYVIAAIGLRQKAWTPRAIPAWLAIAAIVLIPLEYSLLKPPGAAWSPYFMPSVLVASILLGVATMQSTRPYSSLSPLAAKIVSALACNSLGIFCLNPLVALGLRGISRRLSLLGDWPGAEILLPLLSTVLVTAGCLLIVRAFRRAGLAVLVSS